MSVETTAEPPELHAARTLAAEIGRYVRESPENRLRDGDGPYFDEPLVGVASAADPLFEEYRRIIGPFHATPQEVLTRACGDGVRASSVVCWSLPIGRAARLANRREKRLPAREWAYTRSFGEQLNGALRRHVVHLLQGLGHHAVAPLLAPDWKELRATPVGIASTWSERHAAHAAGLGTFSLSDALITVRGSAHRLGSVVTDLRIQPTPRPYSDHRAYCLQFRGGACAVCATRCPVQAINADGHDKEKCMAYVYGAAHREVGVPLGLAQTSCGLCQTKVPCEASIPPAPKKGAAPRGA
jgi:epoxyqueuosine reductase